MGHANRSELIRTIHQRCRICYTCVRECPVKAIKIINGQAEVISQRCIGCGNCVTVCSQQAKVLIDMVSEAEALLRQKQYPVYALLAPSFVAEFIEYDHTILLGMLRRLGFDGIYDVAFGADLVASQYKKLFERTSNRRYISSDCPAVVFFIEHYYPHLVDCIAPICSPMVATARMVRHIHQNQHVGLVFIGPCVAKKAESNEIDIALTFQEVRELFHKYNINPDDVEPANFDGPQSAYGSIFPISRGLTQTMRISDDLIFGNIITNSGRHSFKEAIREFDEGELSQYHLELLCCEGCILGPGMTVKNKHFFKRSRISRYAQEKLKHFDWDEWNRNIEYYSKTLDLTQQFEPRDRRYVDPDPEKVEAVLKQMGKEQPSDFLNCGACGYDTCYEHAVAIVHGYADSEMCLPYTIDKLHKFVEELNMSNEQLRNTQIALRHSEKLAHMGQIAAGIAHELNNPLGVITMYSNILIEELPDDAEWKQDIRLIAEQAERCKHIVSGLLNFARKNKLRLERLNISEFIQDSLAAVIIPDNIEVKVNDHLENPWIDADREQLMQAITNIEKNAIEAMPDGGVLTIALEDKAETVKIRIQDTGTGIPAEHMDKLFTPFFTTKEPGKGTGLGLSIVYGIIKMHRGKIEVQSNTDPAKGPVGTEFIIELPREI